jgi:hypothetical protein
MTIWQLQQAKTRLSEPIGDAQNKVPQVTARRPDLRDFLLNGPKFDEDLDITRDRDTGRKADLD